jgi:hypothetical protein
MRVLRVLRLIARSVFTVKIGQPIRQSIACVQALLLGWSILAEFSHPEMF